MPGEQPGAAGGDHVARPPLVRVDDERQLGFDGPVWFGEDVWYYVVVRVEAGCVSAARARHHAHPVYVAPVGRLVSTYDAHCSIMSNARASSPRFRECLPAPVLDGAQI